MKFDIFFSISQTPVQGYLPTEQVMFENFFEQVIAADELGYETAWIAESHFSAQTQKTHKHVVVPHWEGEVGLNADIFQLSHQVFHKTKKIETGSAVMNIVCNGGPIAAAEKLATFCTLHGLNPEEKRKIHLGFSAGRFEFMNRVSGVLARNSFEEQVWPVLKGKIFLEATEIFLRLLRGEAIASNDVSPATLKPSDFRTKEDWDNAWKSAEASQKKNDHIVVTNRWQFEKIKIIPQDWQRDLCQPIIGSHDPQAQEHANQFFPTRVFNLSITKPEVIDETHARMQKSYHHAGGPWKREYMPRTVFVFLNEQTNLSTEQKSQKARAEAQEALSAYWKAIEGTLDPKKISNAADNALIGTAEEVATQIVERFHPDDRLMLWFDFFNHDSGRIVENMNAFKTKVIPLVKERLRP
ncbi:MAG: LLM class flavin-dependent oxidoreductase [Bdellovibrionales bacterium]